MNTRQQPDEHLNRLSARLEELGLPADAARALVERHTPVAYRRGSALFLRGEPADVLFGVFSGIVKVYCPLANGDRMLIELAAPGDLVGYADQLDGQKRAQMFEAYALVSSTAGLFTRQQITETLASLDSPTVTRLLEKLN